MRLQTSLLLLACSIALLDTVAARRIRVRPRPAEDDESLAEEARIPRVQYYAASDPQEDEPQGVVLVSTDEYNGLYGQPSAGRVIQDNYLASARSSSGSPKQQHIAQRLKEPTKTPPVQTIRNYNKVNDDGSFTFGYEAADGSFKEETRGTDCVVRGKYGYVDPDGNKREFTYVSGNPCDPNAPAEDADDKREDDREEPEDDGPANYPKSFPVRPTARPTPPPTRPPVTVFQNNYDQNDVEEDEPEPLQVLRPQTIQRPRLLPQPRPTVQYVHQPQPEQPRRPLYLQQVQPTTPPSSVIYRHPSSPINITPRPTPKALPATTYRPQLLQVAVTPRPQVYPKELITRPVQQLYPSSTASPLGPTARTPSGAIDFTAEFQKFAQENIISSTPNSLIKSNEKIKPAPSPFPPSDPIYSSELIFDPSSGQYNTQLFQNLPQSAGDFTLNHRIQPYVAQQQPHHHPQPQQAPPRLVSLAHLQQQSPLYRPLQQGPLQQGPPPQQSPRPQLFQVQTVSPRPSQQLYQQQQADIQFQNSQQLFAQQQRARAQNAQRPPVQQAPQQAALAQHGPGGPPQQQFYYIQPSLATQQQQLSSGQIDAFLRGHNIQF